MAEQETLNQEDRNYIDAYIAGVHALQCYIDFIGVEEGMDEKQIEQVSKEYYRRISGSIAKRRAKLRAEGILEMVIRTKCTELEILFVREYLLRCGEKSRIKNAYVAVYDVGGMKDTTIDTKSREVFKRPAVQLAIEEYRKEMEEEFKYSLGEYIQELNENREEAKKLGQVSVMNAATMEKGKVFGYDKKTNKDVGSKENPLVVKNQSIEDLITELTSKKNSQD